MSRSTLKKRILLELPLTYIDLIDYLKMGKSRSDYLIGVLNAQLIDNREKIKQEHIKLYDQIVKMI